MTPSPPEEGSLSRPRLSTVKRLFAVSMNRCAFPGCQTAAVDLATQTVLAEICHIHAQNPGGNRYDSTLTGEQLHSFENLILMCGTHHTLIDEAGNEAAYPAEYLRNLKSAHALLPSNRSPIVELSDDQAVTLIQQSVRYEDNAVHMDFRHAVFRVGGEGGHWGGGGGSGGILTIVGSYRMPPEATVALNGEDGAAPGGGGGGAGAVVFVGRAIDPEELQSGFRVSTLFAADYVTGAGLFNVLNGGWGHIRFEALPARTFVRLVLVVETAGIAEEALIRLTIDVRAPSGEIVAVDSVDVRGAPPIDLTPRCFANCTLSFDVAQFGTWEFIVRSGDSPLATHRIEVREA